MAGSPRPLAANKEPIGIGGGGSWALRPDRLLNRLRPVPIRPVGVEVWTDPFAWISGSGGGGMLASGLFAREIRGVPVCPAAGSVSNINEQTVVPRIERCLMVDTFPVGLLQ